MSRIEERFHSERFYDNHHRQWIIGIHDNESDMIIFVADNFEVSPGIAAKDATADQLAVYALRANGGAPS
jgi:hypothetical protein